MNTSHQPLAYSISQACTLACAGRTTVYMAIRSGALRAVKRGRSTRILPDCKFARNTDPLRGRFRVQLRPL
jgi:excisionase family DNA binding protein